MSSLAPSEALLVVAIGACGYLGALRLWFGVGAAGPSQWASAWALVSVVVGVARLTELNATSVETAVIAGRVQVACAPLLMLTLWRQIGSVTDWVPSERARLAGLSSAVALAAAALFTPWFQRNETYSALDFAGDSYTTPEAGLLMGVLPVLMLGVLAWCLGRTWRAGALRRRDQWIITLGLCGYAAMAMTTVISALFRSAFPGLVEYSPLLVAILAGHLIGVHQRRLERGLEREVAERSRALRESEAVYRGIVENAPIGLLSIDAKGQLEHANARLLAMLGSTHTQFASSFNVAGEENARRSGFSAMLDRSLKTGETHAAEFEFDTWWGRRIATRTVVAPYRDESGAVQGALAIVDEITERRAVEQRLGQAQQLEAIGQLAAGIAHEINNPMAYVRSNLSVLREELSALAKAQQSSDPRAAPVAAIRAIEAALAPCLAQLEAIVGVVRDMREFSRAGGGERELIDVKSLLESARRLVATREGSQARVEIAPGDGCLVLASPGPLRLAFFTLLLNSLRSAGPDGSVRAASASAGTEVHVSFHDDGPTLTAEARARLFEPLAPGWSDDEPNLGLYIARQIAREHGGEIELVPGATRGSTFLVRLPGAPREEP